jgi:hypothetical protein
MEVRMNGGRLARWSPVSGILFVVLFIVAAVAYGDLPEPGSSNAEIRAYYADHGNQLKIEIAYFVITLGAVLFSLVRRLAGSQAPGHRR